MTIGDLPAQRFLDLLTTAVEGGSNYWCRFSRLKRDKGLNCLSVRVAPDDGPVRCKDGTTYVPRVVEAAELKLGLERLGAQPAPFPAAAQHLADVLGENDDAITADVVLQMTVFGEVVFG